MEDPATALVFFDFQVARVPVLLGLAAASTLLQTPAVTIALVALVATVNASVDAAEPQASERPHFPVRDVRASDSFGDSMPRCNSQSFRIVFKATPGFDTVEHKLPLDSICCDRQPSRHFLRKNLHQTIF